jgi:uncharacterized protein YjbI with pentapeptide repeats
MTEETTIQPGTRKRYPTLDARWLRFLVLLLLLVGGGIWFNAQQNLRMDTLSRQQHDTALLAAADQQHETLLVNYMNTLSNMLVHDKLITAKAGDATKTVATALTQQALRELDAGRKRTLLLFLYDTKLISNDSNIVSMIEADLHGVDFSNIDLRDTDLTGANFSGADLHGANLSYATLVFTNFSGANLAGADLHGTNVSTMNVSNANLAGANLKDATGVGVGQLAKARSLAGATMPDGSVHP